MFRKLHNITAWLCGISALLSTACSSTDEPSQTRPDKIAVTIMARSPRAGESGSTLHDDLEIHEGIVLIYDKNGNYEAGEKIDPAKKTLSTHIAPGEKRIVAVINPTAEFRAMFAKDCFEQVVDEFGNPVTYKGEPVWRNIKPVHDTYTGLAASLELGADCLKAIQTNRKMLLLYNGIMDVQPDAEDSETAYVELQLGAPIARVDLHARCIAEEKERVEDAAIRVSKVSPSLSWDFNRSVENTTDLVAKFTGISEKMTAVSEDELFGDWIMEHVKEDAPLATLYTYHTDTNARLEVGLRFKGSADYDWFPLDMSELMKPETYKGLEAGHLYQIFITVYPDKVGHIIVKPWIVPQSLNFTIG